MKTTRYTQYPLGGRFGELPTLDAEPTRATASMSATLVDVRETVRRCGMHPDSDAGGTAVRAELRRRKADEVDAGNGAYGYDTSKMDDDAASDELAGAKYDAKKAESLLRDTQRKVGLDPKSDSCTEERAQQHVRAGASPKAAAKVAELSDAELSEALADDASDLDDVDLEEDENVDYSDDDDDDDDDSDDDDQDTAKTSRAMTSRVTFALFGKLPGNEAA